MFAAGFIDHGIGKVICIDKNMAAAGGNNWQFEVLRLFNPDFQLDGALRADLDIGTLTPAVRAAFNAEGASLTERAELTPPWPEFDGTAWRISDGAAGFNLRYVPWMNSRLNIYQDSGGRTGLGLSRTMCRSGSPSVDAYGSEKARGACSKTWESSPTCCIGRRSATPWTGTATC